jgi:hypothetical protein
MSICLYERYIYHLCVSVCLFEIDTRTRGRKQTTGNGKQETW